MHAQQGVIVAIRCGPVRQDHGDPLPQAAGVAQQEIPQMRGLNGHQVAGVLKHDPLNLVALNELAELESQDEGDYAEKLRRLLSDDQQYILDLACSYLDLGLEKHAFTILEGASETWGYATLYYLAAYLRHY